MIKIPIGQIRILNPRPRAPGKIATLVQSIREGGLKEPIQVCTRATIQAEGPEYDLVCGQGTLEACMALGYAQIPARVLR